MPQRRLPAPPVVSRGVRRACAIRVIPATTFGSVHGALHSTAFAVAVDVVLLLAAVFWIGIAYWVYRDARRRVHDPLLVATAAALALAVPYVGAVVYLLFRPPETLEDVRAREIEVRALEERFARRADQCPVCRVVVEPSFLVCPVCTTQLKQPCARCAAPLEPLWQMCPYCATPVSAAALEPLAAETLVNGNGKAARRAARST
jgi:double zinc ribbon protein